MNQILNGDNLSGSEHAISTVVQNRFVSFDGGIFENGLLCRPDRYRYFGSRLGSHKLIPRGAGLSYSAASFCEGVNSVEHGSFNRVLDFDSDNLIVEVEAGIELFALHNFLAPRGVFLLIQPGHGRITVGGCIAADVHGKNHARDGTFINQVVELTLFHPQHGQLNLSLENEPELFRLTCGGYGLTGHILSAKLRVQPIASNILKVKVAAKDDVISGVKYLADMALAADFAFTWHDFMAPKETFGRGYVFLYNFASSEDNSANFLENNSNTLLTSPNISAISRTSWHLPLFNRWSAKILNYAYISKQKSLGYIRDVDLSAAMFPVHNSQFYFKLFGKNGFHEYQVIIPFNSVDSFFNSVRDYLLSCPLAVTLASAKFFQGHSELIRFTGDGICFSLNFPRSKEANAFLNYLDRLTISLAGTPNIIKDSRLPLHVFEECYPNASRFREQLHKFDPKRLFCSEISRRLNL
jgi:decaprenylphospho-beta-D-ribofuranose 2-oxidase